MSESKATTVAVELTYQIVFNPFTARFAGYAWDDDVTLATGYDHTHYAKAKAALEALASVEGCALKWFDGEYTRLADGSLRPAF